MLGYARRSDGSVSSGPLRLWPGGLAMGRSLGDADCGDAILPEPAIEIVEICADATILVCSDGVWGSLLDGAPPPRVADSSRHRR